MVYGDWLHRRAQLSPSKIALIDVFHDDQSVTYADWNERASRLANFFQEGLEILKGDRLSVYAVICSNVSTLLKLKAYTTIDKVTSANSTALSTSLRGRSEDDRKMEI